MPAPNDETGMWEAAQEEQLQLLRDLQAQSPALHSMPAQKKRRISAPAGAVSYSCPIMHRHKASRRMHCVCRHSRTACSMERCHGSSSRLLLYPRCHLTTSTMHTLQVAPAPLPLHS